MRANSSNSSLSTGCDDSIPQEPMYNNFLFEDNHPVVINMPETLDPAPVYNEPIVIHGDDICSLRCTFVFNIINTVFAPGIINMCGAVLLGYDTNHFTDGFTASLVGAVIFVSMFHSLSFSYQHDFCGIRRALRGLRGFPDPNNLSLTSLSGLLIFNSFSSGFVGQLILDNFSISHDNIVSVVQASGVGLCSFTLLVLITGCVYAGVERINNRDNFINHL